MQNSTPLEALAGQYELHPGSSPSIVGQRPVLGAGRLGRLLQGQRGEQVGRTLGSVFTLCAHAAVCGRRLATSRLSPLLAASARSLNAVEIAQAMPHRCWLSASSASSPATESGLASQ